MPPTPVTSDVEKRRFRPRVEVRNHVYLVLPGATPPVPCTLRNLSSVGALVRLNEPMDLEGELSLLMNGIELRECVVVRCGDRDVGLKFRS